MSEKLVFIEAGDGTYSSERMGLLRVATATATASGFLWWKMKARYAFREVECAS